MSVSLLYVSLLISDDRMDSCEERSVDGMVLLDDGVALLDTDAQDQGPDTFFPQLVKLRDDTLRAIPGK